MQRRRARGSGTSRRHEQRRHRRGRQCRPRRRSGRCRIGGGRSITADRDSVPVGSLAQTGARRIKGVARIAGQYSEEWRRGLRSRCKQSMFDRARRHVKRVRARKVPWGQVVALQERRSQKLDLLREEFHGSQTQRLQTALLCRGDRCEEPVTKCHYVRRSLRGLSPARPRQEGGNICGAIVPARATEELMVGAGDKPARFAAPGGGARDPLAR